MKLTQASHARLKGVHPDLIKVVMRATKITGQDFQITEGRRSLARQRVLVRKGASKTMRSRHLTGHAIDVVAMVGGRVSWEWPLYHRIADAMKRAAREVGISVEWGGDWRSFKDGPHWQLPWRSYPASTDPLKTGAAATAKISDRSEAAAARTLSVGDRGDDVHVVQTLLKNRAGAGIMADGRFGPKTRDAVRAFQRAKGLTADGVVGARTWAALRKLAG